MNLGLSIGLVGPLPPPPGGMANQLRQLADDLSAAGVDVRIASTTTPCRPAWIGRVRGVRAVFRLASLLTSLRALARSVQVMHVMANSGWAWFLCAAPAIRAGTRRGLPVIVHYHGGLAKEFLAKSGARVLPTLKRASAVVVPSHFLKEVFSAHGVDASVIPNGLRLDVFRPSAEREPDAGRVHVVITRNLETVYGIDTAIHAAAILRREFPRLQMSIAGSGPQRRELEKLALELGLGDAIHFTGRLDLAQIADLYAQADVVLNASRADNAPGSLLEAAACGVPIVSTNVGGVPYLVEHGRSAWLVPPDAPELMAQAVSLVARDPELRRRLRSNGLVLAASCGWPAVRQHWLELYRRLGRADAARRAAPEAEGA